MAFASHDAKVVFRVLVAVFHLDHVAGELRFACAGEIPFVVLPRIARILATRMRLRPHGAAPSLRELIHVVCPSPERVARLSIDTSLQSCSVAVR